MMFKDYNKGIYKLYLSRIYILDKDITRKLRYFDFIAYLLLIICKDVLGSLTSFVRIFNNNL